MEYSTKAVRKKTTDITMKMIEVEDDNGDVVEHELQFMNYKGIKVMKSVCGCCLHTRPTMLIAGETENLDVIRRCLVCITRMFSMFDRTESTFRGGV